MSIGELGVEIVGRAGAACAARTIRPRTAHGRRTLTHDCPRGEHERHRGEQHRSASSRGRIDRTVALAGPDLGVQHASCMLGARPASLQQIRQQELRIQLDDHPQQRVLADRTARSRRRRARVGPGRRPSPGSNVAAARADHSRVIERARRASARSASAGRASRARPRCAGRHRPWSAGAGRSTAAAGRRRPGCGRRRSRCALSLRRNVRQLRCCDIICHSVSAVVPVGRLTLRSKLSPRGHRQE